MKANKGKAYFYSYGQLDRRTFGDQRAAACLNYRKGSLWPIWAQVAYQVGFVHQDNELKGAR